MSEQRDPAVLGEYTHALFAFEVAAQMSLSPTAQLKAVREQVLTRSRPGVPPTPADLERDKIIALIDAALTVSATDPDAAARAHAAVAALAERSAP